ncbi:Trk system potassium transporter TrkA [Hippea maritima]|uniref:Trk system potassium uptake protein TrkA n=1 Tax=Hippea maritima (strain ATCC 700847 / DSM 10411 / MH2) TaxID=760142 RepID=F2LTJ5_HIPMA|nr:Trk system potassium transporter TrkA [Hippea maritima]AEA33320.1 TrkA-N domain protein [Hippea maritima DSM 10411]
MNIVIAGAGGVGFHIAKHLSEEKKDVAIIEKDVDKANFASERLDCLVVQGEATDVNVLKEAGCDKADMFIAVTDSDEVNMVSCFVAANNFNIEKKIVRLRNIQYTQSFSSFKNIGIDFIINPEIEAAKTIINTVNLGASTDVITFDIDIQMRGIHIDEDSLFKNKTISEIKTRVNKNFIISAIKREEGELIIPSGFIEVKEGDYLYVVAKSDTINDIVELAGKTKIRIKDIAIFGAGNIGLTIAKGLSGRKRNIKLIDKDYERCKKVASICKKAIVIHGDADDAELFEEENIGDFDVAITATDNEEINLLSAIYAKNLGVKRSIALADKANYIAMSNKLNIDIVISPKLATVNSILRFIRKGKIVGVYSIFGGEAEALEFVVSNNSKIKNKKLKELDLPKGSLVVAINRNGESIIPDGNFTIKENDRAVIFTKKEHITQIEQII